MHKEIEIKIKLDKKQLTLLRNWLIKNSEKKPKKSIVDYYLDNPKSTFISLAKDGHKEVLSSLRVRIKHGKHFICFKKRNIDEKEKTIDVDEAGVDVANGHETLKILTLAGFSQQFVIKKEREIFLVDREIEVVIDDINNLGVFVEFELKNHDNDVERGLSKIYDLFKKIGIREFIFFDRSYIHMMLNPNTCFGEKRKI